jgi:hypothetical protein
MQGILDVEELLVPYPEVGRHAQRQSLSLQYG